MITRHRHTDGDTKPSGAGFRVVLVPAREANAAHILEQAPSVVAVELSPANPDQTWAFVRRFRKLPAAVSFRASCTDTTCKQTISKPPLEPEPSGSSWNLSMVPV